MFREATDLIWKAFCSGNFRSSIPDGGGFVGLLFVCFLNYFKVNISALELKEILK